MNSPHHTRVSRWNSVSHCIGSPIDSTDCGERWNTYINTHTNTARAVQALEVDASIGLMWTDTVWVVQSVPHFPKYFSYCTSTLACIDCSVTIVPLERLKLQGTCRKELMRRTHASMQAAMPCEANHVIEMTPQPIHVNQPELFKQPIYSHSSHRSPE